MKKLLRENVQQSAEKKRMNPGIHLFSNETIISRINVKLQGNFSMERIIVAVSTKSRLQLVRAFIALG